MELTKVTDSLIKAFEDLDAANTKKEIKLASEKASSKAKLAKEVNTILKIKLEAVKALKQGEIHIGNLGSEFGLTLKPKE